MRSCTCSQALYGVNSLVGSDGAQAGAEEGVRLVLRSMTMTWPHPECCLLARSSADCSSIRLHMLDSWSRPSMHASQQAATDLQRQAQGQGLGQSSHIWQGLHGGQAAPAWNLDGTHLHARWQQHGPPAAVTLSELDAAPVLLAASCIARICLTTRIGTKSKLIGSYCALPGLSRCQQELHTWRRRSQTRRQRRAGRTGAS